MVGWGWRSQGRALRAGGLKQYHPLASWSAVADSDKHSLSEGFIQP